MSRTIRSVLQDAPMIDPSATGSQIYDLFSENPDLLVCAVVEHGSPVGLLARNAFFMRMANHHGRDLYARRPITFVMDKTPLLVDIKEPSSRVSKLILNDHMGAIFDGFIITENGEYAGIGTGVGLMKLVHEESEERNRKLIGLAEQLGRARIDALNANQAKSEFLALLSDEIGFPMNRVRSLVDSLDGTGLNKDQSRLTRSIRRSHDRLSRILNDVLDISKLEADSLEFQKTDFEFGELIDYVQQTWAHRAERKGLEFTIKCDDIPEDPLRGDQKRIKQIISNLISNSIKHTTTGAIEVAIRFTPHGLDELRMNCQVTDTGCGIEPAKQARLFDPFNQSRLSARTEKTGSGLGLAICKQLLESMGGSIGFESTISKGSSFWFSLPLTKVSTTHKPIKVVEAQDEDSKEKPRLRVLVVEDNAVNQEVMVGFLKMKGLACDIANNGKEAVEAVSNQHYDLILMDIQMPIMNGIEATHIIRKLDGPVSKTPIIAITANAINQDRSTCLSAGMDGYVTKPINRGTLFHEIDRFTAPDSAEASEPPALRVCSVA